MKPTTIREAELELQIAHLQRRVWQLEHEIDYFPRISTEIDPIKLHEHPAPLRLNLAASVDIIRNATFLGPETIAIRANAVGKEGNVGFCNYITEGDLLSTRASAEFLACLYEQALRQVATHFHNGRAPRSQEWQR